MKFYNGSVLMHILVLVKQVPNSTEVKLDPKTGNLIREGIESIINPDDLHAVHAAVTLKERMKGNVTALSMGPPQAIDALSEAMGMGVDGAILLTDTAFAGADTWATSYTLGKAIEKIGQFDLILCGRQAIDGDTAQIGPQVAEYLEIPHVSYVFEIEKIMKKNLVVKRRLDDGYEKTRVSYPALLTVIGEMNKPCYPHVARLLDACRDKTPIKIWNAADIGVNTHDVGLEGSLTNVIQTFSPKTKREGVFMEGSTKDMVKGLMGKLKEHKLIS
jgi:electron transfer flavoprotein beta subunit